MRDLIIKQEKDRKKFLFWVCVWEGALKKYSRRQRAEGHLLTDIYLASQYLVIWASGSMLGTDDGCYAGRLVPGAIKAKLRVTAMILRD